MYNLATAAAAAGINRSTVLRAIKGGRLSAQRDETGSWCIDPAEFHRVFPPLATPATNAQQAEQRDATDLLVAELRKVIEDLRADRDRCRSDSDRWQAQSDHWRTAFENTQRLLPPPQQHGATTAATEATKPAPLKLVRRRVRWWGWKRAG